MSTASVMNINNEVFAKMRTDFDIILNSTLKKMTGKGDDEATLTIKLVLTLDHEDGYDSDSQCEDDAHDVIKPSVQHKITSVLTTKSNTSGETKGDDALYWDKESGMYVTRPFLGAQTSMFDADKKVDDDKIVGLRSSLMDDDAHEQLSLDGRAPAPQLTAPSDDSANANDDAIDADFHDISEDDCYTVENLNGDVVISGFNSIEDAKEFAASIFSLDSSLKAEAEEWPVEEGSNDPQFVVVINGVSEDQKKGIEVRCTKDGLSIADLEPESEDDNIEVPETDDLPYDAPEEE